MATASRQQAYTVLAIAGIALLSISACSSSTHSTGSSSASSAAGSASSAAGSQKVAASRVDEDPTQILMDNTFYATAKSYGWSTMPSVSANLSSSQQLTDIQDLVNGGATGLMIDPADPKAIIPALAYAKSKHVPVVAIDDPPAGGSVYMIVSADSVAMGKEACEATGKALHGKGIDIALEGSQLTAAGLNRQNGFTNCMTSEFPGIKVVQEETNWDAGTASSELQTALTQYPDASAIFMASDTVFLPGSLEVLKGKGLTAKAGSPKHIYIATIDGTPAALQAMRSGEVDAIISQPITLYGSLAASYLKDALAGKKFSPGPTDHDSTIVSYDGNLMDLLPAPLVTIANVNDKSLWGNQTT